MEVWTVEDIVNALSDSPPKKKKIVIPQFQRTIVWNDNQRKWLIDSIKNGMPIGSILLYKQGENNGITEFLLIDGLQRVSTLKRYFENPTAFFDEDDIDDKFANDIASFWETIGRQITTENIKNYIVQWLSSINGFEEQDGFSSHELAKFLENKILKNGEYELSRKEFDELVNKIKNHLNKVKQESDIRNFKVPIIIYTGDKEMLPAIFERINSKGTQLTKYQIFAAIWKQEYRPFKIHNKDIIKKIKDKYEKLIEEGLDVDGYDPENFENADFSYFEYLFGLGKLLNDKYPSLFASSSAEHEADSVGFNIVAICVKHNLRELRTLPESLEKFNLSELEDKIFVAIDFVYEVLKAFIEFKSNKKSSFKISNKASKIQIFHSEFQIISIIGKVFHTMFIVDKENGTINDNPQWTSAMKNLRRTLPYHYLYDIIKGFWSGTGDKKAMERVYGDHSDYYDSDNVLKKEYWEALLSEWINNEKNKKEKARKNINKTSILFLNYIYTHLLSANDQLSAKEYEIDHIIPLKRLRVLAEKVNGLPISAVSNLALLPAEINKRKRDKTIYEMNLDPETLRDIEELTFTNKDMLAFVKDIRKGIADEDVPKLVDQYLKFLDERFEILKEKFYTLNDIK